MCCLRRGGLVREEGVSSLPFSGGHSPCAFSHRAQPLSPAQPLVLKRAVSLWWGSLWMRAQWTSGDWVSCLPALIQARVSPLPQSQEHKWGLTW